MPSTLTTVISGPHTSGFRAVKETSGAGVPVKPSKPAIRSSVKTPDRFDGKLRHPWEKRKALSEEYENEKTGRESWWRTYIRETPIPGSYDMEAQGLLYDMNKKQNTYRFKSDGRKVDPSPHGKGAILLPGAYNHTGFIERLEKTPATYHFNSAERSKFDMNFGIKDKNVNVSPDRYAIEQYLSLTSEEQPSKHAMFKSQSRRFPTLQFKPKEGPAPGNYESHVLPPRAATFIQSSFKSKTPRFSSSHTRVPGPGTYERTFQASQSGVLTKMGRQHGLFFSSAFQA